MQQAVGEGVFPGSVRGFGLFEQVGAADDAVLVIAQQCLDGFGRLGYLLLAPAAAAV